MPTNQMPQDEDLTTTIAECLMTGAEVVLPVGPWMRLLKIGGGMFNALWTRARQQHGAAIPEQAELLKMISDNQAEIDAGKI